MRPDRAAEVICTVVIGATFLGVLWALSKVIWVVFYAQ